MNQYEDEIEEERMRRRRKRREEMRRRKQKQRLIRKVVMIGVPVLIVLIVVIVVLFANHHRKAVKNTDLQTVSEAAVISLNQAVSKNTVSEQKAEDTVSENEPTVDSTVYTAEETADTAAFPGEAVSTYGILVDTDSSKILAEREAKTRISPASMTKILTVLVAAEHVKNLDAPVTVTTEITDYAYVNDCSNVGFQDGETVPVRDLFYGTILPSGADAAVALAEYVAGSQEEFVALMNQKLTALGLADTAHMTNCVGIYDENHYCTAYDMAMILDAAIHNEICREVLSAHTYTTSVTAQHPEGITISNWFLRRIEDKETGGTVLCAKTGYVVQSGNCAASFATSEDGKNYICVTANSTSAWRCIYDHVAVYQQFMGGGISTESKK